MLTILEIKEKLTPIFLKNGIRKAIVFGSYPKNMATDASDIDLVIDTRITGFKFFELRGEMEDLLNILD